MAKHEKLLIQILRGTSDANIPFDGLCSLLKFLGFEERVCSSHHIFTKNGVEEILNVQQMELHIRKLLLLANIEVIIQEWIETAKELGRSIPKPKGRLVFA